MLQKVLWLGAMLSFLGLGLVACQGGAPAGPQTVQVRMSEFKFEPDPIRVKAGQEVRLDLVNEGTVVHEFMVGRDAMMMGHGTMLHGYETDFFGRGALPVQHKGEEYQVGSPEEIEETGWHVEVEPGGKVDLAFTVSAENKGEWEIGCFTPGHYQAGMKGKLIVE
jgi:uncharacterized cupredoxin-like copper-binding protein